MTLYYNFFFLYYIGTLLLKKVPKFILQLWYKIHQLLGSTHIEKIENFFINYIVFKETFLKILIIELKKNINIIKFMMFCYVLSMILHF